MTRFGSNEASYCDFHSSADERCLHRAEMFVRWCLIWAARPWLRRGGIPFAGWASQRNYLTGRHRPC